jgi:hypothetical protein
MLDAMDAHVIDVMDPKQRQQILEALGLREFETALGPDMRRAHKENAMMDSGEPALVRDTDDHAIHLTEHELVMKDPAFDSKPPEVQALYTAHRTAHKDAIAQLQLGLNPQMQPEPGAPTDPVVQQAQQIAQTLMPPPPPEPGMEGPPPPGGEPGAESMNGGAPPIAGPPPEGVQPPPA